MTGKHVAGAEPHAPSTPSVEEIASDPQVQLDEDAEPYDLVPDPERTVELDGPAEVTEAIVDADDARRDATGGQI